MTATQLAAQNTIVGAAASPPNAGILVVQRLHSPPLASSAQEAFALLDQDQGRATRTGAKLCYR